MKSQYGPGWKRTGINQGFKHIQKKSATTSIWLVINMANILFQGSILWFLERQADWKICITISTHVSCKNLNYIRKIVVLKDFFTCGNDLQNDFTMSKHESFLKASLSGVCAINPQKASSMVSALYRELGENIFIILMI